MNGLSAATAEKDDHSTTESGLLHFQRFFLTPSKNAKEDIFLIVRKNLTL